MQWKEELINKTNLEPSSVLIYHGIYLAHLTLQGQQNQRPKKS
jgi:hypothetical protein